MTESLLVPLDQSPGAEAGLVAARGIAGLIDASIRLMSVVVPNSDKAEAFENLQAAAARADVEPTDIEVVASTGPALEIVRAAEAHGDLVCMASHGRGRFGELMLGSVSQAVIALSTAPVLLVGPRAEVAPRAAGPVVVPLDGSPPAAGSIGPAIDWAARLGVGLHLLHATRQGSTGPDPVDGAALIETALPQADAAGIGLTAEVLQGDPVELVTGVAHSRQASLLVLTSRGATAELTLSKVARRIVHRSPVPVLVVPHHA